MSQPPTFTNRLIHETSPYLRQHAHNPVDWYAWGEEAIARAKQLDRPIFLSIGYSACHWCHVMEHESFEDPEVARLLNDNFVSIKVDREERPDLDQIYMTSVQILTGRGGWPMSVFLTPDLKPFYGGTYFPPDERYAPQMPSFKKLLSEISRVWRDRRVDLDQQADQLTANIQQVTRVQPAAGELTPELLRAAASQLRHSFDPTYGGFGAAPKFPHAMELRLLLRVWKRFGDDEALDMAKRTLDGMARGGMYDHLGGGFHRYSTDREWLVPHFEKMLYDNALLTVAYLEAYQATDEPFYRGVVAQTLDYVLREMTSSEGPFYSTQDADSEGVEGKFFVWSLAEVEQILGPRLAETFCAIYDLTAEGNWEGHNILRRTRPDELEARLLRLDVRELRTMLAEAKEKLLFVRSRRVRPGRDEKVLTSWNALMIDALALAAQVLEEPRYLDAARNAASFLLERMRTPDGRLFRTWSEGAQPKLNGYLEDYSFLLNALVTLYEATFEPHWIASAIALATVMVAEFWDKAEGGFFYTAQRHETLIARTKDPHDSSIPSGNSMAACALLRLAKLTGRHDLRDKALQTLQLFRGLLGASPLAAGQMLLALDFHLGPVDEVALVGGPNSAEVQQAVRLFRRRFRPWQVIAAASPPVSADVTTLLPLLANKQPLGPVTTYLCRDFACQTPLVGVSAVEAALG